MTKYEMILALVTAIMLFGFVRKFHYKCNDAHNQKCTTIHRPKFKRYNQRRKRK